MSTELYLQCFVACLIGNIIHVALKVRSLAIDYKKANLEFSFGQYLKDDKWALILDAAGSFGIVYLADEWIDSPYIMGKIKTLFVLIGITGSYLILMLTSVSKKKFRQAIDDKTDIADGKK